MSGALSAAPVPAQLPQLPATGFLRLKQIIGDPKADPPVPALIPVSRSSWIAGCKSGRYPKPVQLSPSVVAWRVESVLALIERLSETGQ